MEGWDWSKENPKEELGLLSTYKYISLDHHKDILKATTNIIGEAR